MLMLLVKIVTLCCYYFLQAVVIGCYILNNSSTINGHTLPAGSSPIGRWNHYALVKSNGAMSSYFNGVKLGSSSQSSGYIKSLCFGGNSDAGGGYCRCYIDNFIISDTARYTDNFTPPESPVGAYCNLMYLKDKEDHKTFLPILVSIPQ